MRVIWGLSGGPDVECLHASVHLSLCFVGRHSLALRLGLPVAGGADGVVNLPDKRQCFAAGFGLGLGFLIK